MPHEQHNESGLYGITDQNSSRHGDSLWGKNQFNSAFPLALCLYMRDRGINPVGIVLGDGDIGATDELWTMEQVVGGEEDNPHYHFESSFVPYSGFSRNVDDKIDLVVSTGEDHAIALEIKLTVVPDSGTSGREPSEWAPEMVLRPVSSAHAMMGVARSLMEQGNEATRNDVVEALKTAYNAVSKWDNESEILRHSKEIYNALEKAMKIASHMQKPFLLQPIWRTMGQSLELCNHCFDVFAWSDVSIMNIPVREHAETDNGSMTRWLREIARHVRSLYDILQTGDYDYSDTYKGMALGLQTDKSFALPGRKSIQYLRHPRLEHPRLPKDALHEIVLNGGEARLKPERRFDAAVQAHMINR